MNYLNKLSNEAPVSRSSTPPCNEMELDILEIPPELDDLLQIKLKRDISTDNNVDLDHCEILGFDVVIPKLNAYCDLKRKYNDYYPLHEPTEPYVKKISKPCVNSVLFRFKEDLTEEEVRLEQQMVESGWFICKLCDEEVDYGKLDKLKKHLEEKHPDGKPYTICCGLNINKYPSEMYDHMRFHFDRDVFKCPQCESRFNRACKLTYHIAKVHNPTIECVCHICGRGFYGLGELNTHIATSHDYRCRQCKLSKHLNFYLLIKYPHLTIFFIELYSNDQLREHYKTHSGRYVCHICGMALPSKLHRTRHITNHSRKSYPSKPRNKAHTVTPTPFAQSSYFKK